MQWSLSDIWDNVRYLEIESGLFTLVLIIGATLEYWVQLRQFAFQTMRVLWFWRTLPYERRVWNKLAFHAVAPILVVVGIAGELVFETRTFIVEDLETVTLSQEIKDANIAASGALADFQQADKELDGLRRQIGQAGLKADLADTTSDSAQRKASNALTVASGARKEADTFERDIVSAKQQAADAESHFAEAEAEISRLKSPRMLTNANSLSLDLKQFAGTEYTFSLVFGDNESLSLLDQIDSALQLAGWKRVKPSPVPIIGMKPFKDEPDFLVPMGDALGIEVDVDSKESTVTLNAIPRWKWPHLVSVASLLRNEFALHISPIEGNVNKQLIVTPGSSPVIRIAIGEKQP